jgi:signal transduction histidine kinase
MGAHESSVVEIDWPSTFSHLVSIAPLGSPQDEQSGWVMILRDISHLKQIDDLKLRMLNDAAGKIRLPLAEAISKLADLSGGTIEGDDAHNTTIYQLTTILGRIQDWIDELLTLVQVEAGVGFSSEVLAIGDALNEELKSNFEEVHHVKGLHLELNIPREVPKVSVDPKLFERMLSGLLTRAAQRSQIGGVVEVSARVHQDQVWIELSDQGLPSGRKETNEEDWGTGGLPQGFNLQMVRAIVQKLGGQVWVRGQDRIGSTIAISLPTTNGN